MSAPNHAQRATNNTSKVSNTNLEPITPEQRVSEPNYAPNVSTSPWIPGLPAPDSSQHPQPVFLHGYGYTHAPPFLPPPPIHPQSESPVRPAISRKRAGSATVSPGSKRQKDGEKGGGSGTRLTTYKKLEHIFSQLKDINWTFGDFLYHSANLRDPKDPKSTVKQPQIASNMFGHWARGNCTYTLAHFITAILQHPSSLEQADSLNSTLYSPTIAYQDLKAARPVLTTFAVQAVEERLMVECRIAANINSGLHSTTVDASAADSETFQTVEHILKEKMPVSFRLFANIASPTPRNRLSRAKNALAGARAIPRKQRPVNLVVVNALSSLVFSRNRNANRIPLLRGRLLFACMANEYIWAFESRVGMSVGYHAVLNAMRKAGERRGTEMRRIAHASTSGVMLQFDNVQKYCKPRFTRLGRENRMITGTAATAFQLEDFSSDAVDLADRLRRLREGGRAELDFEQVWESIDHDFLDKVTAIMWVMILVENVPRLASLVPEVTAALHAAMGCKKTMPARPTRLFTMPTTGYGETTIPELVKCIRTLLAEMGMTKETFLGRLWLAGGDGLSFERLIQLQVYLQFEEHPFDRLEFIVPLLEAWHEMWTEISRIYEAHFDTLTSKDPSTIGHGANILKRKAPATLKKVDYYPYTDLAYIQLVARVLDCWRLSFGKTDDIEKEFESMDDASLPVLSSLIEHAERLVLRYGSPAAFHCAATGEWPSEEFSVPIGKPWLPPSIDRSSTSLGGQGKGTRAERGKWTKGKGKSAQGKRKTTANVDARPDFEGDESLARTCRFIYDAMLHRTATYATRHGHVGCLWEIMKTHIISFAGSTHTKYSSYLLELFCTLELESSPELRDLILSNYLVNPSGLPGHFEPGDLLQEQVQDEIYEKIGDNEAGFDDPHVRTVIAPNAYEMVQTKKSVRQTLDLSKRSGKHTTPAADAERRRLRIVYREEGLHTFRKSRTYSGDPYSVDHIGKGETALQNGKLKSWATESYRIRHLRSKVDLPTAQMPNILDLDPVDNSAVDSDGTESASDDEENASAGIDDTAPAYSSGTGSSASTENDPIFELDVDGGGNIGEDPDNDGDYDYSDTLQDS